MTTDVEGVAAAGVVGGEEGEDGGAGVGSLGEEAVGGVGVFAAQGALLDAGGLHRIDGDGMPAQASFVGEISGGEFLGVAPGVLGGGSVGDLADRSRVGTRIAHA